MWPPNVGLGTGEGTRGWPVWVSSVVMIVIAALFVIPRVVFRWRQTLLGLDDYFITASFIISIVLSIAEIEAVKHGYGRHYVELTKEQAVHARIWFFVAQITYKLVLPLSKFSICCMYYRLFQRSSRAFRLSCYAVQTFIFIWGVIFSVGAIFQCKPVSSFWNREQPHTCFKNTAWWISFSIIQILTDFILLFLPIRQVLLLKMSKSDKIGLILVFSTGLFTTITSIIRLTTLESSARNPDPTYGPLPATTWAVIEANSGIIAACLPLLKKPFAKLLKQLESVFNSRRWNFRSARYLTPSMPTRFTGGHSANQRVEISSLTAFESETQLNLDKGIYLTHDIRITSANRSSEEEFPNPGRFDAI